MCSSHTTMLVEFAHMRRSAARTHQLRGAEEEHEKLIVIQRPHTVRASGFCAHGYARGVGLVGLAHCTVAAREVHAPSQYVRCNFRHTRRYTGNTFTPMAARSAACKTPKRANTSAYGRAMVRKNGAG